MSWLTKPASVPFIVAIELFDWSHSYDFMTYLLYAFVEKYQGEFISAIL